MAAGLPGCKAEGQGSAMRGPEVANARQRILLIRNRHPARKVRLGHLRRVVLALFREAWPDAGFDLAIRLVAAPEIAHLNETFLRHKGSTDVISFDYSERTRQASLLPRFLVSRRSLPAKRHTCPALLHGEIVVCLDEAVRQSRRFHTTWQSELVRYVVHGVLHLLGYDDRDSRARRRMKAAEDALVRRLARQFVFSALGRTRMRGATRVQPAYNRSATEIQLK